MKRTKAILALLCMGLTFVGYAQEFSMSYGKISVDELAMTTYEKDTTAHALILCDKADLYYEFVSQQFRVVQNIEKRVKILDSEGTDYANVTIPIYQESNPSQPRETISRIEAYAYNLENGKTVRTKMEKSYIFEERLSPYYKQIKFSIPSVRAGTVIEYRYRVTSDFYYSLPEWEIQNELPVMHARYQVKIPEYFLFNIESKGFGEVQLSETQENQSFNIYISSVKQTENIHCTSKVIKATATDLPALKDQDYVWCVQDFRSRVTFELQGIKFPYSPYKPHTTTWADIERLLREHNSWGGLLSLRNPFREEWRALNLTEMKPAEKVEAVFALVRSKISWNGKYGFYGDGVRQAIKDGVGNNAEINFVLLSVLKDAGIVAHPVLLSRRDRGRLPFSFPSLNKLNTFVIAAQVAENKFVYLDGSTRYGGIDTLSPLLMVDRAWLFNPGAGGGGWVNLTQVGNHTIQNLVTATLDDTGTLNGERNTLLGGRYAVAYKEEFYAAEDSIAFVENISREEGLIIREYKQTQMEPFSTQVRTAVNFSKPLMQTDTHIYFNPMIVPHITKNSFTDEHRELPVEFAFPYSLRVSHTLRLPEGVEVEELPESSNFRTEDGSISCQYSVRYESGIITLNYVVKFDKVIFATHEYTSLKQFWEMLVQKNNEQVVLRKTTSL